jgi:DNA-binding protein HU-beta
MNKSDLVDALAGNTGMTKADAARAVDALFAPDKGIIAKSTGRNPRTGETIKIAATKTPSFRAGKGLKDGIK